MAKPGITLADVAEKLLRKFPKISSLAAARQLHEQEPALFPSIESARTCVRRIRGAQGEYHRKNNLTRVARPKAESQSCERWGFVPPADPNPWKVHSLPKGPKRWLEIADVHIPYHDRRALVAALDFGKQTHCDGVIILGDLSDCYQLSFFLRDPRQRSFKDEVDLTKQFLRGLVDEFGTVVWKFGNHDDRLQRYLMRRAPELFDLEEFSFKRVCELDAMGVFCVPPNDPIVQGQLSLLHGHEWGPGTTTPVNPARTAFLKAMSCVQVAHQHRMSEHAENSLLGTTIAASSLGCLCSLNPAYRPLGNKWNHSCGVLDLRGGDWKIENHRIIDGKVM